MKFSKVKFRPVEEYLKDVHIGVEGAEHYLGAWAKDVYREFCGKRSEEGDMPPQPTSIPEVACNEFVEYVTQRFFPTDGSWINIEDKDEDALESLNLLRKRISESNFYSKMAGFIKNGTLFNTALITCDYGGNELNFVNYDIFRDPVRVIDHGAIKRGFIQTERQVSELREIYNTEGINLLTEGSINTYLMYFPIIDRYITGDKPELNDRFFSIEVCGNNILKRKDGVIPTFPTFPIHAFRPSNVRSMGHEALGEAIELKTFSYALRQRVKYANDPSFAFPDTYFNRYRDVLKKDPNNILKEKDNIPIPAGFDANSIKAIKLENEIPVDMQYIQLLSHNIFHIFKAELITRAKLVGLTTAEEAQREIGINNELAPLMGHVVANTAKNLIGRAISLLQNNDAEFQKTVGKRRLKIFTDIYLKNVSKYEKINKMIRFLEAVGAVGSINPADAQAFKGREYLEMLAKELEIPGVLGKQDEVNQQNLAMSQAATQPQVDEAKAEKDQSDALLKQAQAQQIEQGLV